MARPLRPRSLTALLAAVLLAGAAVPTTALGPAPIGAAVANGADPGLVKRITGIRTLKREVFGYLPYWRLDSRSAQELRYDLVSTIAFFGIGIKKSGNLDTDWVGYKEYVGKDAAAVTNAAHRAGVRVIPTFQLFDSGAYTRMNAFLDSSAAQDRFIGQAIALMKRRLADGASLDFEHVNSERMERYLAFVTRFAKALRAQMPGAILVDASSAGTPRWLIAGLAKVVDHMFVMTYNYRWSGSNNAGAVAPLDNTTRTVKKHIAKFLAYAPASKVIMGVPYYGYDWPVISDQPNARVRSDPSRYGGVRSVTYGGAMDFLAAHPEVTLNHDDREGAAFYSYWSATDKTWRQVYFDDERSLAAKYDYAIAENLAGIGTWTLLYDRGYDALWDLLRRKFYAPKRDVWVGATLELTTRGDQLVGRASILVRNDGTIPESGRAWVTIDDATGAQVHRTSLAMTVYPGRSRRTVVSISLGPVAAASSSYSVRASFRGPGLTMKGRPATVLTTR